MTQLFPVCSFLANYFDFLFPFSIIDAFALETSNELLTNDLNCAMLVVFCSTKQYFVKWNKFFYLKIYGPR